MKISRAIWLLLSAAAVLLIGAGITYGWFVQNTAMATLMDIVPPDDITIIPTDQYGNIPDKDHRDGLMLDLDFREGVDEKDKDGTIHIRRPICVESTSPIHQLEIVHTTNLSQLSFKIYPAVRSNDSVEQSMTASVNYNPANAMGGSYVNQDTAVDSERVAKEELLENYKKKEDVADVHAYPLYWLAVNSATAEKWKDGWQQVESITKSEFDPVIKGDRTYYYTYYYLEISWKETTKETDLFYVMARNIAQ